MAGRWPDAVRKVLGKKGIGANGDGDDDASEDSNGSPTNAAPPGGDGDGSSSDYGDYEFDIPSGPPKSARTRSKLPIRVSLTRSAQTLDDEPLLGKTPVKPGRPRPRSALAKVFHLAGGGALEPGEEESSCTHQGHLDRVRDVAISEDGRVAVTASDDKTAKRWDLGGGGRLVATMKGHVDDVTRCLLLDSGMVITASMDGYLFMWKASGELFEVFQGHTGGVIIARLSPDQRYLVSGSKDSSARIWTVAEARLVHTLERHTTDVDMLEVTHEHVVTASVDDTLVCVWNLKTGKLLRELELPGESIRHIAVGLGGRYLAACSWDKVALVWRLPSSLAGSVKGMDGLSKGAIGALPGNSAVQSMGAMSKGALGGLPGNGAVKGVGVMSKGAMGALPGGVAMRGVEGMSMGGLGALPGSAWEPLRLEGHSKGVTACVFIQTSIVTSADDGTCRVWSLTNGKCKLVLAGGGSHTALRCVSTHNGNYLVSISRDGMVKVWNIDTGSCMATLEAGEVSGGVVAARMWQVRMVSGGVQVVTDHSNYAIRCLNLPTDGVMLHSFTGHTGSIEDMIVSRRGDLVVSAGSDTSVRLWSVDSAAQLQVLTGHDHTVTSLGLSPDDKRLVTGSRDGSVNIWSTESGKCVATLQKRNGPILHVAVSPSGSMVATAGCKKSICCSKMSNGQRIAKLTGHTSWMCGLEWLRDGKHLLSWSLDTTIRLWTSSEPEGWQCVAVMRDHEDKVVVCRQAMTRPGSGGAKVSLVSGSYDGTARLWEVHEKSSEALELGEGGGRTDGTRCVHVFEPAHGPVTGLHLSESSGRLLTHGRDTMVCLWSTDDGSLLATFNADGPVQMCAPIGVLSHILVESGQRGAPRAQVFSVNSGEAVTSIDLPRKSRIRPLSSSHLGNSRTNGLWALITREKGADSAYVFDAIRYETIVARLRMAWSKGFYSMPPALVKHVVQLSSRDGMGPLHAAAFMCTETEDMEWLRALLRADTEGKMCAAAVASETLRRTLDNHGFSGGSGKDGRGLKDLGTNTLNKFADRTSGIVKKGGNSYAKLNVLDYAITVGNRAAIRAVVNHLCTHASNRARGYVLQGHTWVLLCEKCPDLVAILFSRLCTKLRSDMPSVNMKNKPMLVRGSKDMGGDADPDDALALWSDVGGKSTRNSSRVQAWYIGVEGLSAHYPNLSESPLHLLVASGNTDAINSTCIQALITFKWEKFARFYFYQSIASYTVFILLFTSYQIFHEQIAEAVSWGKYVGYTISAILVIISAIYLLGEAHQAVRFKVAYFADPWNYIEIISNVFCISSLVASDLGSEQVSALAGVTLVLLWMKLVKFARGFERAGTFVKIFFRVLLDVREFMALLFVVLLGFTFGFSEINNPENVDEDSYESVDGFSTVPLSLFTLFRAMLGDFDVDDFSNGPFPGLSIAMFIVYVSVVSIILLNLLIAILSDSYAVIQSDASREWRVERAVIVTEMEMTMHFRRARKSAFPKHIHMLIPRGEQVNEPDEDEGDGGDEDSTADGSPWVEYAAKLDEKIEALGSKVDTIIDRLDKKAKNRKVST